MEVRIRNRVVTAITFPADDVVLAERVREILDSALADVATDRELAGRIAERLSIVYPAVTTRFRDALAGFGERQLYIFRDGTARSSFEDDTWTTAPDVARVVTDAAGRYLEANAAAERLFGVAREAIVAASAGTFTRPDARIVDSDALWRSLAHTGRLHSLSVLQCPDGHQESIEFETIRDGDGPGRNVTYLRPVG
jgi:PAS domain-containing protein